MRTLCAPCAHLVRQSLVRLVRADLVRLVRQPYLKTDYFDCLPCAHLVRQNLVRLTLCANIVVEKPLCTRYGVYSVRHMVCF